ncbi:unnamed protein product [Soboliphyme baturini]|uniref:AraC family transcriptional regulator n=1 Tax=Soboliphyme baturini TaxID=241478 RepID=A0A183INX0_9BILA|nr:unnamed protein product [Soboliphyme baturini]
MHIRARLIAPLIHSHICRFVLDGRRKTAPESGWWPSEAVHEHEAQAKRQTRFSVVRFVPLWVTRALLDDVTIETATTTFCNRRGVEWRLLLDRVVRSDVKDEAMLVRHTALVSTAGSTSGHALVFLRCPPICRWFTDLSLCHRTLFVIDESNLRYTLSNSEAALLVEIVVCHYSHPHCASQLQSAPER